MKNIVLSFVFLVTTLVGFSNEFKQLDSAGITNEYRVLPFTELKGLLYLSDGDSIVVTFPEQETPNISILTSKKQLIVATFS